LHVGRAEPARQRGERGAAGEVRHRQRSLGALHGARPVRLASAPRSPAAQGGSVSVSPSSAWARAGARLAGAASIMVLGGCAATPKITVHWSGRTSDGDTMYMAIRAWDGKPTSGERYQEVAARLFLEPPDPAIIATQPILPGNDKTQVTINEDQAKEV